ncbi:hypothetical protein MASB_44530 [Mycobacteroides abscessus subsp. bolletii BD]|nr:hypothetical protein MASB_44530 [Mycobacteroides abscessus subsp. bolletii BD]
MCKGLYGLGIPYVADNIDCIRAREAKFICQFGGRCSVNVSQDNGHAENASVTCEPGTDTGGRASNYRHATTEGLLCVHEFTRSEARVAYGTDS